MSRFTAHTLLLFAAAIWGGGFIAQADAMREVGPLWFVVLRFALATLAILPMVWFERRTAAAPVTPQTIVLLLAMGLAFSLASLLQQLAVTRTSVTHVGFLTGLYVLFVPLLGTAVLRQRPHVMVLLAAAAALGGTWLIGGGLDGLNAGDILAIGCALGYAVQILLLDVVVKRTGRPATAVLIQSLLCAGLTLPLALSVETLSVPALPAIAPALLFAGILSGGLAFVLQAVGQSATTSSVAAVLLMSESLFAALFAVVLLGEALPFEGWIGCGLLFASLLMAQCVPQPSLAEA